VAVALVLPQSAGLVSVESTSCRDGRTSENEFRPGGAGGVKWNGRQLPAALLPLALGASSYFGYAYTGGGSWSAVTPRGGRGFGLNVCERIISPPAV
jgi:hypothetical protein